MRNSQTGPDHFSLLFDVSYQGGRRILGKASFGWQKLSTNFFSKLGESQLKQLMTLLQYQLDGISDQMSLKVLLT